jgi:hypothetical protein
MWLCYDMNKVLQKKKNMGLLTIYFGQKQNKTFQISFDEEELERFREWAHESNIYYTLSKPKK